MLAWLRLAPDIIMVIGSRLPLLIMMSLTAITMPVASG